MKKVSFKNFYFVVVFLMFAFLSCHREPEPESPVSPPLVVDYSKVFVAHAGGAVEGYIRTNSLEGLNASYANGFRMFELDLQLSTDNKIVAVHDPIFVTEEEFLATPILGKFTPMNMDIINEWFEKHNDAILVTDKINRPDLLAQQFRFKNRLIMELFTWEAVEKALELEVIPMVSQNIFWKEPNIEERLDNLKVTYIGMHREYLANDKQLLKRLKEKGYKTYVWFTLNEIEGMKPEEYVWKNDMEFCYGMYANSLLNSPVSVPYFNPEAAKNK